MQENEFERKMKEQMGELKLRPSEAVWPNVESELKRKKRRRVIFYIFLLAGLGLAGFTGYILFNTVPQTELVQQDKGSEKHDQSVPGNDQILNEGKTPGIEKPIPGTKQSAPGNEILKDKIKSDQFVTTQPASVNKKYVPVTVTGSKMKTVPGKPLTETGKGQEKNIVESKMPENKVAVVSSQNESLLTDSLLTDSLLAGTGGLKDTTSLKDSVLAGIVHSEDKPAIKADSLQLAAVPGKKTGSKIKLGFDLSAGSSFRRDKLFSLPAEKAISQNIAYYAPPTTNAGTATGRRILPPSSVRAGFSGKIGVVAELELNRRNHLSAGLRYAYLSESIKIGSYNDTVIFSNSYSFALDNAVNGVYRSAQERNFRNKYHFIELPLLYQLQLNKGNKVPVLWNIGIVPAYLISTNALLYDSAAGGIYYHDAKAYNRMHFNVQSGFSFVFGNKKKIQWSVGPEFSLDMVTPMKQDVFIKNRYIMYGGISGRLFLLRIKK